MSGEQTTSQFRFSITFDLSKCEDARVAGAVLTNMLEEAVAGEYLPEGVSVMMCRGQYV